MASMKKVNLTIFACLFFVTSLYSKEYGNSDTSAKQDYKKHQVSISTATPTLEYWNWITKSDSYYPLGFFISYYYRPYEWLWIGLNSGHLFGRRTNYDDYSIDFHFYTSIIAPEVKFSYLHKKRTTLYSGISVGCGIPFLFHSHDGEFYWQVTALGFDFALGKNRNFILGGELGIGYKGLGMLNLGYRF